MKKFWKLGMLFYQIFPYIRLEFLQMLSQKYRLFLLSNTDSIHIETFENKTGISFYSDFYQCFEKVYFSFEIGMRKPNADVFQYIINKHELSPKRTLFVDDKKENTDTAACFRFSCLEFTSRSRRCCRFI